MNTMDFHCACADGICRVAVCWMMMIGSARVAFCLFPPKCILFHCSSPYFCCCFNVRRLPCPQSSRPVWPGWRPHLPASPRPSLTGSRNLAGDLQSLLICSDMGPHDSQGTLCDPALIPQSCSVYGLLPPTGDVTLRVTMHAALRACHTLHA